MQAWNCDSNEKINKAQRVGNIENVMQEVIMPVNFFYVYGRKSNQFWWYG